MICPSINLDMVCPKLWAFRSWAVSDNGVNSNAYRPQNEQFAHENTPSPKGSLIFQPSIFYCYRLLGFFPVDWTGPYEKLGLSDKEAWLDQSLRRYAWNPPNVGIHKLWYEETKEVKRYIIYIYIYIKVMFSGYSRGINVIYHQPKMVVVFQVGG